MNLIKRKELVDELKYKDTVILTYKIEYPEIISSQYILGKNTFNQYNKEKAIQLQKYVISELYKYAKSIFDYNFSQGYPVMVFEVISKLNITYNENCLISLYFDQYEYTGGAHGNTIRSSQTWNLKIAKIIDLSSFYPNNSYYIINILKNINNIITIQIQAGSNYYFDNYCQLMLENFKLENYFLIPNNIVIFFQQYDIAPYSSGIPQFNITFDNLPKC